MDMETICSMLKTPELWVHSAYIAKTKSIKHEIRRKTFIPWVPCDVCRNPIWLSGWRCELCQIKFHAKCSYKAPLYCDLLPSFMHDEEVNFLSVTYNCQIQKLQELAEITGQAMETTLGPFQPNPSPVSPEPPRQDFTPHRLGIFPFALHFRSAYIVVTGLPSEMTKRHSSASWSRNFFSRIMFCSVPAVKRKQPPATSTHSREQSTPLSPGPYQRDRFDRHDPSKISLKMWADSTSVISLVLFLHF